MSRPIQPLRQKHFSTLKQLGAAFEEQQPVTELIQQHSQSVDELLISVWQTLEFTEDDSISCVAIGGYGREELLPYSDIDLLILYKSELNPSEQEKISEFIRLLWDIGLDISHSVCNLDQSITMAKDDITVMSSFLEARHLLGSQALNNKFINRLRTEHIWSDKAFFEAKCKEQNERYQKYGDTAYILEPNIKNGPGGLRDVQTILWIAKHHFNVNCLKDLIKQNFITEKEYQILNDGQIFLQRVAFSLHLFADRRENRLLFDYQPRLAKLFSYEDDSNSLAVELFMKQYYRIINSLRAMNDMLLQLFREAILSNENSIEKINDDFQITDNYIEVTHPEVFKEKPSALLSIFILMTERNDIQGVRASTIRLIREHIYLIDDDFRNNSEHQQLFIELFKQPVDISQHLQRLNRYGIFGKYLPAFEHTIGLMQFDLFHAYTVDQHTIFLIRNLHRFTRPEYRGKFPLCASISEKITKIEILRLAALFHDIAKGLEGNHSEVGANIAETFCQSQQLSEQDTSIVIWLVKNHLLMSQTTQKKDIYDPVTVFNFSQEVHDQLHLDYLYLLTVADICATNPTLWNSWKDTMLSDLYSASKQVLNQQNKSIDETAIIVEKKSIARELLFKNNISTQSIDELWSTFKDSFFLYETPTNIAWQSEIILSNPKQQPLVFIKPPSVQQITEIFIYTSVNDKQFAISTAVLANNAISILESHITTTRLGFSLAKYIILDESNNPIDDQSQLDYLKRHLQNQLAISDIPKLILRRTPRNLRHFKKTPRINFDTESKRNRTIMEVITVDQPGLLARISQGLLACKIRLHTAKITTLGERVEDVFYITNQENQAINNEEQLNKIREAVIEKIM